MSKSQITVLICNVNKPGPSTNMPLPTLKLYYIDLPKMGWPLKTMLRTGKNGKNLSFSLKNLEICAAYVL